MNQITKTTLAAFAILVYAIFCISAVDGHDSSRPHTHSEMIVVQTGAFNNITGVTNDPMTNVNLQTVLDAMDNSTLPTASNIVINTNNFGYFAPTNNTLQVLLDWQDDNAQTNLSNTNIYMTSVQSSNAFVGTGTTEFIRNSGGQVGNDDMAANSVNASNLTTGMFGLLRARTNENMDVNGNYTNVAQQSINGAPGTMTQCTISNIQVSQTTMFTFHGYLSPNSLTREGIDLVYFYVYVGPTASGPKIRMDAAAMVGVVTNGRAAANNNFNSPATITFVVPQSNWYNISMLAGSSLGDVAGYTCNWALTRATP